MTAAPSLMCGGDSSEWGVRREWGVRAIVPWTRASRCNSILSSPRAASRARCFQPGPMFRTGPDVSNLAGRWVTVTTIEGRQSPGAGDAGALGGCASARIVGAVRPGWGGWRRGDV